MRLYVSHVTGLITRYLIVFGCIDLYLITHTSVRKRSWSSVKIARNLVLILCTVGPISGLHLPIFMDLRGNVCDMFGVYKFFYPIYQLILVSLIPPILMGVFGFLAVRSIHQRQATLARVKQSDRDLMRMLVSQIIIHYFSSLPYSANLLYGTATFYVVNKSPQRVEIESFFYFLGQLIIQYIFVAPFYLFILSSKSFRRDFMKLVRKCWYKNLLRGQVRVAPIAD